MIPEELTLATLQTMGIGTIASLFSLYLSYSWELITFQSVKWTRNQIATIYLGVISYMLLNSTAFSLLILGVFFPTLLYDIFEFTIVAAVPFILIAIVLLGCVMPNQWRYTLKDN